MKPAHSHDSTITPPTHYDSAHHSAHLITTPPIPQDVEEEEDTESGDPDVEHRSQRISTIENKLDKYKKLLQEEESILQVFKNEYVLGMEGSMSDKETNRYILHVHCT